MDDSARKNRPGGGAIRRVEDLGMFKNDTLTPEPFPSLVRVKNSKRCSELFKSHSGYGNVPKSKATSIFLQRSRLRGRSAQPLRLYRLIS